MFLGLQYHLICDTFIRIRESFDFYKAIFFILPLVTAVSYHWLWFRSKQLNTLLIDTTAAVETHTNDQHRKNKYILICLIASPIALLVSSALYIVIISSTSNLVRDELLVSLNHDADPVMYHVKYFLYHTGYLYLGFNTLVVMYGYIAIASNLTCLYHDLLRRADCFGQAFDAEKLLLMRGKLQLLFDLFNRVFGVIPLILCAGIFCIMVAFLVFAVNHSHKLNSLAAVLADIMALGALFVVAITLVIFASLMAEGMEARKAATLQQLTEVKLSLKQWPEKLIEVECVRESICKLTLNFTAANFFTLNRSLLLSMVSSLLPLSVLLCQLSGAIK